MEWLSKSTKRLLAEMSAGIIFYNVILVILAVLLLPRVSLSGHSGSPGTGGGSRGSHLYADPYGGYDRAGTGQRKRKLCQQIYGSAEYAAQADICGSASGSAGRC